MNTSKLVSQMDAEYNKMMSVDKLAMENGVIKGRVIMEPVADGRAYYVITRVNKKSVRIQHQHIYDGYSVSYWGAEATIDMEYALRHIESRDYLDGMIEQRKAC
ncbi:MAG: hypothetical protein QM500_19975 [Methylococcales bacterium]